jgi:hypothetical protein
MMINRIAQLVCCAALFLLLVACGLSPEERLKLIANGEIIPFVFYDVDDLTKERLETVTVEVTYDPETDELSGPLWTLDMTMPHEEDILSALEGRGGADEIRLHFSENKLWDQDRHGFYFTSVEESDVRDERGKKRITLQLRPLVHIPMDELRGRNTIVYRGFQLAQAATTYIETGRMGLGGIYSPLWLIRNPSRKRAHMVLLKEGESVDTFLIAIGVKEDLGKH